MALLNTPRDVFNVTIEGRRDAPALMLSNSRGTTVNMWTPQIAAIVAQFLLIRCAPTRSWKLGGNTWPKLHRGACRRRYRHPRCARNVVG